MNFSTIVFLLLFGLFVVWCYSRQLRSPHRTEIGIWSTPVVCISAALRSLHHLPTAIPFLALGVYLVYMRVKCPAPKGGCGGCAGCGSSSEASCAGCSGAEVPSAEVPSANDNQQEE